MVKFLLYLFESGLCLSILFLVYLLFFRKETYFRFNRVYLLSIMLLSLIMPLMHINLSVTNTNRYESTLKEIGKFKSYYEKLIAMSDPGYYRSIRNVNTGFEEYNLEAYSNLTENNYSPRVTNYTGEKELVQTTTDKSISIALIILLIYLIGVVIFLSRIIILFQWVFKTILNNKVEKRNKIKIVHINQNLPPFSFLGYVFVNRNNISDKSEEILAHEEVHVEQFHSIDLLIAHSLSIFQWFNPFVWVLQKSIKTNHEYLADNNVVDNGYDLLDYQELLLNHFISIPSVQLVNNFNLISIKNRIIMMNKIKSGITAKLKALLVIPAAIFTFILFANLTLNGPGRVLTNLSFFEIQNNMSQLKGLWKNVSKDTYGYQILFENSKFSVLEKNINLKEYPYEIKDNSIILSLPNKETTEINYEIVNNQLKIWWNSSEYSLYNKSGFDNSLDDYLSDIDAQINLPEIENYWLLERPGLCIDVAMVDDKIFVSKKPVKYTELETVLLNEKSKINKLDANIISIRLYADKNVSMKYINDLSQVLRKINLLKIVHMGAVADPKVSKLQRNFVSMPKMLPPLVTEDFEIEDLEKKGITYFEIDATKPENSPENIKPKFKELITNSEKYIVDLYYDKTTLFNTYLAYQDMARSIIYEFREKDSSEKYNMSFDELPAIKQKEIRGIYPLIISEANSFKETN
ncbi:MAG TPA: hypothetical protein DCG75_10150 [Bacteroidales bacterium]|nr:hypothetical protein [Bacteroidales bacterium]